MLDHDTDSYYKISRAFVDKQPTVGLTRDTIVDNITLYWLRAHDLVAERHPMRLLYCTRGPATLLYASELARRTRPPERPAPPATTPS